MKDLIYELKKSTYKIQHDINSLIDMGYDDGSSEWMQLELEIADSRGNYFLIEVNIEAHYIPSIECGIKEPNGVLMEMEIVTLYFTDRYNFETEASLEWIRENNRELKQIIENK